MEKESLRSPYGEGWNEDGAATGGRASDRFGKHVLGIARVMFAVTVGRFQHQVVNMFDLLRVPEADVIGAAKVAGKQDLRRPEKQFNHCRAQNVAGIQEPGIQTRSNRHGFVEWNRPKPPERRFGIGLGVQGQRGLVLRESVAICEFGVTLLKMSTVGQEKTA